MKRDLMDIICCPVCKSELRLKATKENETEVLEGTLTCIKCRYDYRIDNGIPNLLPPDMQ